MMFSLYTKLYNPSLFFSSPRILTHFSTSSISESLYKKMSALGDPQISMVPVLDEWVKAGNTVSKQQLQQMIKELTKFRRYKHALEISLWMTDKMYNHLAPSDIAARLNLILKVHGLEQVENYFNNIPTKIKGFQVYTALLNSYTCEKSVNKAEKLMCEIREMGILKGPLCYNLMMNMYYRIHNYEKLDALILQMEKDGIRFDQFSFGIRICAYAAASDPNGIDETVRKMESDPNIAIEGNTYIVAANGYLKVGMIDKAITMLKKSEELINLKSKNDAFDLLLKLYAESGRKDEVYRIWNRYKTERKVYNKGYICIISSVLKVGDIEIGEMIFKEWESRNLSYHFRIPELLVNAYCQKGLVEKAESLLQHVVVKGIKPSVDAYSRLATTYLETNDVSKAKEAITNAISVCLPECKSGKEVLDTCLKHLGGGDGIGEIDELMKSFASHSVFSWTVLEKLVNEVKVVKL